VCLGGQNQIFWGPRSTEQGLDSLGSNQDFEAGVSRPRRFERVDRQKKDRQYRFWDFLEKGT
jgi:hypothetical protein